MPDPLDQLERLAVVVDGDAALAAFSAERVRRRRRRTTFIAAAVLVTLVAVPALIAILAGTNGDTQIAADGDGGTGDSTSTSLPVDTAPLDFEVVVVLEQTGEDMGTMRAALDAASYSDLWASFGEQPDAPDIDESSFVLAITIPDDACPPTLERFIAPENSFVPVFIEPEGGCDQPLIPKTFVVAVSRAGLPGTVVFRLPADGIYSLPEFELVIDLDAGTTSSSESPMSGPTKDDGPVPGSDNVSVDTGDLAERYERCAIDTGFDPGGVQVLVDASGVPTWVKTGLDVPPSVHGPCFESIGGIDTGQSSHGLGK